MTGTRLLQIDAFADRAFVGNPAAVRVLNNEAAAEWMQAVAAEMNLSETAFVCPQSEEFALRWFTPAVEVELCGHATLGGKLGKSEMTAFQASARGGVVRVRLDGNRVHLGGRAVTVLRGELLEIASNT